MTGGEEMNSKESQFGGQGGEDICEEGERLFRIVGLPRWGTKPKVCSSVLGRAQEDLRMSESRSRLVLMGSALGP